MAKRKYPTDKVRETPIGTVLANIKDHKDAPRIYANHAQFGINLNEIFIDFYRIEPDPADGTRPVGTFLQRVIVPIGLGKGFASGMANLVDGFEKATGMEVPNNRKRFEDDTIDIWKEEEESS